MSNRHVIGLTASEIASLWSAYMSCSIAICLSTHFLTHLEDKEARNLISDALKKYKGNLEKIEHIFTKEKFPVPRGYTEEDVDLTAPPLFFDLFPLSCVYATSRLDLVTYSTYATSATREDIRAFFSEWLRFSLEMFNRATELMLEKGIYDRPALIPYPDDIHFTNEKPSLLTEWFKPKRPLNVLELSDIFFNLERNYYAVTLLTAFTQIVRDEEIKKYLVQGKKLANRQIEYLNETLAKEDLLGTIMINTEVTTSTSSPFSERLILGLITLTNAAGIAFMGHSLSTATRTDLAAEYSKLIVEIMNYGKEGVDMLIERGWMEEPPRAADRKKLAGV